MSAGKTNNSGYLSKIIERESRLRSKNNDILKPTQKPITPSNINNQINPPPGGGTEDTNSDEFQKADRQQNHTPLISEIEEEVVSGSGSGSGSGFSPSSSSLFDIDQEDKKTADDAVNEKLRKRSVSGKVLGKGFDDMKSEEQTIKPSENIFEKPKQTKELREEDFFGITTYHKDSNNYPTRDIVSDAKEMNHDERKIGQHKDHDQAKIEFNKSDNFLMKKIGDSDKINLRKTDSREEQQPQQLQKEEQQPQQLQKEEQQPQQLQKDKPKKENLEAPLRTTYKDNADESFLRRIMERADNTTKLPQKQSKETRLTIGNINIQITNSNTVNNNSRNVNIKETSHVGNSADLAIWGNTFDKTYYWKFRYT